MPELSGKLSLVMAGLVPAIHAFLHPDAAKTRIPVTSAGMAESER
jgi:hypothetical protein